MKEIWKDVEGYEGLYQVSNLGRVRSLDHYRKNGFSGYITKGRILKQQFDGKKRYLHINFSKNGIRKMAQVHTLVGKAFVNGYKKGLEIDHKDTITTNNKATNLVWVTRSQNMRNPITHKKILKHHIEVQSIPVIGISIIDKSKISFNSVREAKRNGFKGIGENIHGRCKQCKGYVWRYANEISVQ